MEAPFVGRFDDGMDPQLLRRLLNRVSEEQGENAKSYIIVDISHERTYSPKPEALAVLTGAAELERTRQLIRDFPTGEISNFYESILNAYATLDDESKAPSPLAAYSLRRIISNYGCDIIIIDTQMFNVVNGEGVKPLVYIYERTTDEDEPKTFSRDVMDMLKDQPVDFQKKTGMYLEDPRDLERRAKELWTPRF